MLNQPMVEKLLAMRLHGMVDALKAQEQDRTRERVEFPGTTLAADRSAMELARESGVGAKTESGQAAGSGLRGGYRLSRRPWPGQSRDARFGKRLSVGSQSREHPRDRTVRCGQELPGIGSGAEGLSRWVLGNLPSRRCPVSGTRPRPSRRQLASLPGTIESHRCSGHR